MKNVLGWFLGILLAVCACFGAFYGVTMHAKNQKLQAKLEENGITVEAEEAEGSADDTGALNAANVMESSESVSAPEYMTEPAAAGTEDTFSEAQTMEAQAGDAQAADEAAAAEGEGTVEVAAEGEDETVSLEQAQASFLEALDEIQQQAAESADAMIDNAEQTLSQKNASLAARSYLTFRSFSRQGIIAQLMNDGYPEEDATYAADSCGVDYNEQAAKSAKKYLETMPFSRQALVDQLMYDGFSVEEAEYGVTAAGY